MRKPRFPFQGFLPEPVRSSFPVFSIITGLGLFIAHDLSVVRFLCDRIAVIHRGRIVELAESEELFAHPLHPYTRALLSAIPQPDPIAERKKKLLVYDPSCHHYSESNQPSWREARPSHFVLASEEELAAYQKL